LDAVLDEHLGRFADGRKIFFHDLLKPVIIVSAEFKTGSPAIFKNWENSNYLAADVMRATSAAPTFFDPIGFTQVNPRALPEDRPNFHRMNAQEQIDYLMGRGKYEVPFYIDGGVYRNNPAAIALDEVISNPNIFSSAIGRPRISKTPFRVSNQDVDRNHVLMLSIGTGTTVPNFEESLLAVKNAVTAFEQSMVANSKQEENTVKQKLQPSNYFRFNPTLPASAANMDNAHPDNLKELERLTLEYLNKSEVRSQVDALVTKLVGA
jgi:patatin-like phospholipase/acyl hydrolase